MLLQYRFHLAEAQLRSWHLFLAHGFKQKVADDLKQIL